MSFDSLERSLCVEESSDNEGEGFDGPSFNVTDDVGAVAWATSSLISSLMAN